MNFLEVLFGEKTLGKSVRKVESYGQPRLRKERMVKVAKIAAKKRGASVKSKTTAGRYTRQELLEEVVRVLQLSHAKVSRGFFEEHSSISPALVEQHFGSWPQTLKAARPLLGPRKDKLLLEQIDEYLNAHPAKSPESGNSKVDVKRTAGSESGPVSVFGDFLNFRGVQHAPVNEQGVVFLFGMICRELGYVVEIVRQGFPDCEAKRQVAAKRGGDAKNWTRVRIEFEFQSKSFLLHGHDAEQCDMIVCWEHNWTDCPLEVLELRKVIPKLPSEL